MCLAKFVYSVKMYNVNDCLDGEHFHIIPEQNHSAKFISYFTRYNKRIQRQEKLVLVKGKSNNHDGSEQLKVTPQFKRERKQKRNWS